MNKIFEDEEFGAVTVSKNAGSRGVGIRVREREGRSGTRITVTIPYMLRYQDALGYLDSRRNWVRNALRKQDEKAEEAARDGKSVTRVSDGLTVPTLTSLIVFRAVSEPGDKIRIVSSVKPENRDVGSSGNVGSKDAVLAGMIPCRTILFPLQWIDAKGAVPDDAHQALLKEVLVKVIRNEAKSYLSGRLSAFAERYGFEYGRLAVKHNSSNWGSCSRRGNINLNLNLMRLPQHLCDYVILHELCHLREPNHGPRFHRLLDRLCLDNMNRLRDHGTQENCSAGISGWRQYVSGVRSGFVPESGLGRILGREVSKWRMI